MAQKAFLERTFLILLVDRFFPTVQPMFVKFYEWVLGRQRASPPGPDILSRIKMIILDFDGVMTDNRVIVMQDGNEAVTCSRSDGMGIQQILTEGVVALVLSTEANPVVQARCNKLGIPCIQNLGTNNVT